MRAYVLDTDVLVAALRSDAGAPRQVLQAARAHRFELLLSVPLMLEYESLRKLSFVPSLIKKPDTAFPTVVDVHWETERRTVWSLREYVTEKQELIYEVSWISELGA